MLVCRESGFDRLQYQTDLASYVCAIVQHGVETASPYNVESMPARMRRLLLRPSGDGRLPKRRMTSKRSGLRESLIPAALPISCPTFTSLCVRFSRLICFSSLSLQCHDDSAASTLSACNLPIQYQICFSSYLPWLQRPKLHEHANLPGLTILLSSHRRVSSKPTMPYPRRQQRNIFTPSVCHYLLGHRCLSLHLSLR